jgi:hypothetical protein
MKSSTSDLIVIAGAKGKPGKEAELEQALVWLPDRRAHSQACLTFRVRSTEAKRIGFRENCIRAQSGAPTRFLRPCILLCALFHRDRRRTSKRCCL